MKFFVVLLYLFKPKNWLILFGILINVAIMTLIGFLLTHFNIISFPLWQTILIIVGIYLLIEFVLISPLGEMYFRKENKMLLLNRNQDSEVLYNIFDKVYEKAQEKSRFVSRKIKIYFIISENVNAFALGSRTLCITSGLLNLLPNQIEGILAHEFGHIVNLDSNIKLFSIHGNAMLKIFVRIVELPFYVIALLIDSVITYIVNGDRIVAKRVNVFRKIIDTIADVIINIAALINMFLFMTQSRIIEYEADEYAYKIGEGKNLSDGLKVLVGGYRKPKGIVSTVLSSHPNMHKRIERLDNMIEEGNV